MKPRRDGPSPPGATTRRSKATIAGRTKRRPHARWLWALRLIGAALVLLLVANPVTAAVCGGVDTRPPPELDFTSGAEEFDHLPTGAWVGFGSVAGEGNGMDGQLHANWNGRIDIDLDFVVEGEPGRLGGEFEIYGHANTLVQGVIDGRSVVADATYDIDGNGRLDGDNEQIQLNGTATNTGSALASVDGTTHNLTVSNSYGVDELLELDVTTATCILASGRMTMTIAERGVVIQLVGDWEAASLPQETRDEAAEVLAELESGANAGSDTSPFLDTMANRIRQFDDTMANLPNASTADVLSAMSGLEALLNTLRNLTPCQARLFGEQNLHAFAGLATVGIAQLVASLHGGSGFELGATELQQITQIAVRTGAIGAGSTLGPTAESAEAALKYQAERILERNLDPEDKRKLVINDTVLSTMATAVSMNWTLEVRGQQLDAVETWSRFWGSQGKNSTATPPSLEACDP